MNIENHVPQLETCRRLKEAGFEQDSYFGWHDAGAPPRYRVDPGVQGYETYIAAPLLSESFDALPQTLYCDEEGFPWQLAMATGPGYYEFFYRNDRTGEDRYRHMSDGSAEAAALLWLYLHEAGLLHPTRASHTDSPFSQ